MFLYNVTIIVERGFQDQVRKLIESQLTANGEQACAAALLELLDSPHEGTTFCVQVQVENREALTAFRSEHVTAIEELAASGFPGKILLFDSTMQYLIH